MGYISIREIIDNLTAHPLMRKLTLERAVNYAVHFMRIVNCPQLFEEKYDTIPIKAYRGMLPCDFYSMKQVRMKSQQFDECLRYSSDTFFNFKDRKKKDRTLTYKIQGQVIVTSFPEGKVDIVYTAFPVDDEGYPLILDDSTVIRALEAYIKKQMFTVLFDMREINENAYVAACQDYAWAVGQAQNRMKMVSVDQMESIGNGMTRLVPTTDEHRHGFREDSVRQITRI